MKSLIKTKKKRRYPLKLDKYGRSARSRAFKLFEKGMMPAQAANIVDISKRTARRYFADWKKMPENLDKRYKLAQLAIKEAPFREEVISIVAKKLEISESKAEKRLQKPWGLKQFLSGKWFKDGESDAERRRRSFISAGLLLASQMEKSGFNIDSMVESLEKREKGS